MTAATPPVGDPKAIMGTTWLLVSAVVAGQIYDSPQPPAGSDVWGTLFAPGGSTTPSTTTGLRFGP